MLIKVSSFDRQALRTAHQTPRWSAWLLVVVSCLVLATAPTVTAQDAQGAGADRNEARALFQLGVSEFEAGHYEPALKAFDAAYRLAPHPIARINMANCLEHLGRYPEASFNYQRFLDESGKNVSPEQRREVEAAIQRMEQRVGTLAFDLSPANAEVLVDGEPAARNASGEVRLVQGPHVIRVSAAGYLSEDRDVLVHGGAAATLKFRLLAEPPPPAVVAASAQSAKPRTSPMHAERVDEENPRSTLFWVAAGTTASLAVGAAVSGGMALSAERDFDKAVVKSNDPQRSPMARDLAREEGLKANDRATTLSMMSDVMLAGSVIAGGATLLVWLRDREQQRHTSLRAGPLVLKRGGGGVAVGGRF